jgi:putative redox protein
MSRQSFSDKTATATLAGPAFTTQVTVSGHHFTTDEPLEDGGLDLGPSPTRLLRAALAACQAITMRSYANRKQWPLESVMVQVDLQSEKIEGRTIYAIISAITLTGPITAEQRERLRDIATRCPVHRILAAGSLITTEFAPE